jgi:threonine/homoserine/homoserine lactone efflux protein
VTHVLGDILGLAAAVAVSPVPVLAVILILVSSNGRVKGMSFALGWLLGLSGLGVITLAVAGSAHASSGGHPAAWVGWLKLVLGIALGGFAIHLWRRRPTGEEEAPLPAWMAALDHFGTLKTLGVGVLLSAASAKNAPITIAAAAAISSAGIPVAQQLASLAVFVLIGSVAVLAPVVVYLAGGRRAAAVLDNWRRWAADHNTAIMAVLFVVIGLKLIGDGIDIILS